MNSRWGGCQMEGTQLTAGHVGVATSETTGNRKVTRRWINEWKKSLEALGVNTEEKFSLTIYLVSVATSSALLNLRCISPS